MITTERLCAEKFLIAAERWLAEGVPLECARLAQRACELDRGLEERARGLVRRAADLPWVDSPRDSDEANRLRRFVSRLEASLSGERFVRDSGPRPPSDSAASPGPPGDALSEDVRRDAARVLGLVEDKEGRHYERVAAILRALLARFPVAGSPSQNETGSPLGVEDEDEDACFWEGALSLEHELHSLGNSLYKVERYEDAIAMYDLALHVRPDLLETFFNRGLAYTRLGRYERAEEDLNSVIALNVNLAEAWYTRGLVREYRLDYDGAIADYDRALEADPKYVKAENQRRIAQQKRESLTAPRKTRDSDNDYEGVVKDYSIYRVKPDCRLSMVGDHTAIKREFRKILTYLGGGQVLDEWGGELPRGVLLYGESGAGKTHLARALAGEADVPFYAPPMSLLFDMYVGNSEKSLRNLFEGASQHEHAIVFLDEIDVIASRRSESRQAHEPWQARLSACLLEELDNIARRGRGIVLIGATNCLETIDPAFLRPGRFTYVIEVKRPAELGMIEIFLVCLETALHRAKRADFLDETLEKAVLAPRQATTEHAALPDRTGLLDVARLAVGKEMVGDDVREIVRRVVDERIMAGLDGIDLGPIAVDDLRRHVEEYVVVRKG